MLDRQQCVLEYIIANLPALGDSPVLVKTPVDAQANAALAVLILRLGERRETAGKKRSHISLGGEQCRQGIVRRLGNGCIDGGVASGPFELCVAPVAAYYGVDHVKDGNVSDGHRPAASARASLFAVNAVSSRAHRCVVEATGVNGDLIPVTNRINPGLSLMSREGSHNGTRPVALSQETAQSGLGPGGGSVSVTAFAPHLSRCGHGNRKRRNGAS